MKMFGGIMIGLAAGFVLFKGIPMLMEGLAKAEAAKNPEIHNTHPLSPDNVGGEQRNPHALGPKQTRPGWSSTNE